MNKIRHEDWEALVAGAVRPTRQEELVEAVKNHVRKNRRPMLYRELMEANLGFPPGGNLERLVRSGRLRVIARAQYIPGPNA